MQVHQCYQNYCPSTLLCGLLNMHLLCLRSFHKEYQFYLSHKDQLLYYCCSRSNKVFNKIHYMHNYMSHFSYSMQKIFHVLPEIVFYFFVSRQCRFVSNLPFVKKEMQSETFRSYNPFIKISARIGNCTGLYKTQNSTPISFHSLYFIKHFSNLLYK